MKNIFSAVMALGLSLSALPALAATTSAAAAAVCNNPSANAETNVAMVKKFYQAFNTHNKALLDQVLANDWEDIPKAPGQGAGLAGMKAAMDAYYASFPDFTATNEAFLTSGNKVVVRSTIRATQSGEFSTVPASGKKIEIMAIDIHEVCNGKVARTWHVEDWLGGLFQMGGLPLAK